MCAFFNTFNFPFKWIAYLITFLSIYTFLHWFLAVPLLYSHFYDCCNKEWSKNWIVWFFVAAFGVWLAVLVSLLLFWCCLRACVARRENQSDVCIYKNENKPPPDTERTPDTGKEKPEKAEVLFFSELTSKGNFAVLQVNDLQQNNTPISGSDIPIPLTESCHFVQNEFPSEEKNTKSPKTPREIFFQDMIKAASGSYFYFDPEKIFKNLEKDKIEDNGNEKSFFVGSQAEKENLMSEVFIPVDVNGLVTNEPVVLGQFQVLKD